jgi:hypothetical protein
VGEPSEVWVVRAHAALSVLLGEVERLVGDGDDLRPVEPELGVGDDTGGEPYRQARSRLEQAHAADDPVRDGDRLLLVPAEEEQGELVAADPERLAVLPQPARHLGEYVVALRMAERVVQLLEVVDVEQAHAERQALLLGLADVVGKALVEVAVVAEAGERVGEREPHGGELAEDRALVEGDRGERADERRREKRRAVPEHRQHQGQRGHDGEGEEGRRDRAREQRHEPLAGPAADHRGHEWDVDRVEGSRGEPDLEGEPAEAAVRDERADGAGRRGRERVDRAVEEDPDGRLAPDHLHEQLGHEAHDDRRRPAVDRRRPDDEYRGERGAADRDVLDRHGEGLDERGRDEQRRHAGKGRRRRLEGGERRQGENGDERSAEDDGGDDREEAGRLPGHPKLPRVLGAGAGDRLRGGHQRPFS